VNTNQIFGTAHTFGLHNTLQYKPHSLFCKNCGKILTHMPPQTISCTCNV